jgi:hypothetical protein
MLTIAARQLFGLPPSYHTWPCRLRCLGPVLHQDEKYRHIQETWHSKPPVNFQAHFAEHNSTFEPQYAYVEFPNFERSPRGSSTHSAVSPLLLPSPALRVPVPAVYQN